MKQNSDTPLENPEAALDSHDPRWQLVERVMASPAFRKSARLRELLHHLARYAISDQRSELTEQRIGQAVFGKPADYSPTEDSSVRVHIRQLRLKLHEYFDSEGRSESLILEIPRGGYAPLFKERRTEADPVPAVERTEPVKRVPVGVVLPWAIAAVLAVAVVILWFRGGAPGPAPAPWPLSAVFNSASRTHIVTADVNYGLLRILAQRGATLEEYVKPDFRETFSRQIREREGPALLDYLNGSVLTSFADVAVVGHLLKMAGDHRDRVSIRPAKDLRLRDFESGNFILLGSQTSNPWTLLFDDLLNFGDVEGEFGGHKHFRNRRPLPGEKSEYRGLSGTGSAGEDYATIALLPGETGLGNVLIIQGLQQEGTEAAGLFLADEGNRQRLNKALGRDPGDTNPTYFEALLRTRAMAGSSRTTSIVAVRRIQR